LQRGIHSDSSIPRISKNPASCGVEPSPTPTMPISGDSSTLISTARPCQRFHIRLAAIQPAVPPPTITRRSGPAPSFAIADLASPSRVDGSATTRDC
jgi:hypothetical protein